MFYNKIIILGSPGSGKSTLALKLGAKTSLPVYHLDKISWKPNWEMQTQEYVLSKVSKIVKTHKWIIDGGYSYLLPIRLQHTDLVIFMDKPMHVCLYRIIKRSLFSYGKVRVDMGEGCPERFDWSFIKWVYKWHKKGNKTKYINAVKQSGKPLTILNSNASIKRFLNDI